MKSLRFLPFAILVVASISAPNHAVARCFGVPGEIGPPWFVHMNVTTEDGKRDGAEFGAARGATEFWDNEVDVLEEGLDRELLLYFEIGAGGAIGGRFLVPANVSVNDDTGATVWPLLIDYRGQTSQRFRLEWSAVDLARVPSTWSFVIRPIGAQPVDMRSQFEVEVVAGPGRTSAWIFGENEEPGAGLPSEALAFAVAAYAALVGVTVYLRRRRRGRARKPTGVPEEGNDGPTSP